MKLPEVPRPEFKQRRATIRRTRQRAGVQKKFWGLRAFSSQCVDLFVPEAHELQISQVGPVEVVENEENNVGNTAALIFIATGEGRDSKPCARLRVRREGAPVRLLLAGGGYSCELEVSGNSCHVDITGYMCYRQRLRTMSTRKTQSLHHIRLRATWSGISFSDTRDGQLIVTNVPKVCFSSATFGEIAAPQVSNVHVGDKIILLNGKPVSYIADHIVQDGHELNTCHLAQPPHLAGTMGKLSPTPCISCDFFRRRRDLGLAVALQMWIKAVKSEQPIILSVRSQPQYRKTTPAHCPVGDKPLTLGASEIIETALKQQSPGLDTGGLVAPLPAQSPHNPLFSGNGTSATVPTQRPYNPLRPAANTPELKGTKPTSSVQATKFVIKGVAGGLAYEDHVVGSGSEAKQHSQVLVGLKICRATTNAVIERAEVWIKLGEAAVGDGWVDGNVELEEVLSAWGKGLVGMRVGGTRRLKIPLKLGFRSKNTELVVDVKLKQLK